jgi:hypothetical protein
VNAALPRAEDGDTEARLDAVTALSYLAAVTERVRLGFGVLVLPQRQPVLMAKQITSIDVLCGGRLIVGVAAGLRTVAAECERPASLGGLEITITLRPPVDLSSARRYEELGVHRLLVQPSSLDGSDVDQLIHDLGCLL